MAVTLRILIIEDNEDDAALMLREIERGGYEPVSQRVETPGGLHHALQQGSWDVVLADWSLPQFSVLFALEMVKSQGLDLPFIIVSGVVGEETVMTAMKAGAHDFVPKQNLHRLMFTIERELREAEDRRASRKAELALAASEERLQLVARATNDAVREWELSTNQVWWNEGFFALFGYKAEDIEPGVESWYSRLQPEDKERVIASCYAAINGGAVTWSESYRFLKADGSYAQVLDRSYIVRNIRGQALRLIGAITDLTALRNAEERLRQTEEQLRQAQKMEAIGRLAGGVAHDFNNLLTVITGYVDLIISNQPAGASVLDDLQEIRNAAERASWLTRQLLVFSRRQVVALQVLDLNALVRDFEKMLHRIIGEDVQLTTELTEAPALITADPGQIEQIIMNLAVNARDAMPGGGRLSIETHTEVVGDSDPMKPPEAAPRRYVLLAMSDTWCGMDEETQKRIFEPFFTTKEVGKGTGLGLSTVYGIVKQSDGFIKVYSEPGHGTTFTIYLPAVEGVVQAEKAKPPHADQWIGMETILLVEDDMSLRTLTKKVLEANGYTVLVAANLDEAAKAAEEQCGVVHLLLTDVIMPGGSGPDVAARIRKWSPNLRVLYMSGYTGTAMSRLNILEAGSYLIQKPYSPDVLLQKVREVLNEPR
jgi:two-component system, cell cycle sensor histidine kinase and response regulator CckA